jgi:hypothetical protein
MSRLMNSRPLVLPYDGMSVVGFKPHRAPNPQCCSDPGALCPSCAKKALDENVHNSGYDDLVFNSDGDDNDAGESDSGEDVDGASDASDASSHAVSVGESADTPAEHVAAAQAHTKAAKAHRDLAKRHKTAAKIHAKAAGVVSNRFDRMDDLLDLDIDGPVTNYGRCEEAPEMAPPSLIGNCSCDHSQNAMDGEGSPFTRNVSRLAASSGGRDENSSMAPPTINWAEESRCGRHAAGETVVLNGGDPNADMDGELRL